MKEEIGEFMVWVGQNYPDIFHKYSEDDDDGKLAYEQTYEKYVKSQSMYDGTGKITAKGIIAELRQAWKEFGKYTYGDKGADEVMDISDIKHRLKASYDGAGIIEVLKEVARVKDSENLISSIIQSFEDDDEIWLEMEKADYDFIGEYY
jgi:hypothetical protein